MPVITAEGLVKIYRSAQERGPRARRARPHASRKAPSSVCSGPNGAGKTTTVRILATLLRPDAGHAHRRRLRRRPQAQQLRSVIGLSGQYAAVDENLTGRENLWMFGRLYQLSSAEARRRADELLEQFDADRRRRPGRQDVLGRHAPPARPRQRPDRAAAPALPRRADDRPRPAQPARACGTSSATWSARATTLLLTTQYLEEADELADTIAVVDHGKIIARGTADELKAQVGGERIEVVVHDRRPCPRAIEVLSRRRRRRGHASTSTRGG